MGVSDSLITANKQLMRTKERECHEQILGKLGLPIFAKIFITSNITQRKRKEIHLFPLVPRTGARLQHWAQMEGVTWVVPTLSTACD